MRTVRIVKLNWLEDSLLSKSGKPLDTAEYEWEPYRGPKQVAQKRKKSREEDESVDDDESKTGNHKPPAKRRRKSKMSGTEEISKDERIEAAGELIAVFLCLTCFCVVSKTCSMLTQTQENKSTLPVLSLKRTLANVSFGHTRVDTCPFGMLMDSLLDGYRPFTDHNGIVYLLTLVRKDILKNRLEKHRIKVRYAPFFSSQPETSSPGAQQITHRSRQASLDSVWTETSETQSSVKAVKPEAGKRTASSLTDPVFSPCPVPLYHFPKPYSFSRNPVIACSLPRHLQPSNSNLRVRIPDPWAQTLQLFVSDKDNPNQPSTGSKHSSPSLEQHPDLSALRTKSYACYTVYTKPGQRYVETLAPPGSTFDFAWMMFTKFFEKKAGVEWTDIHNGWRKGLKIEKIIQDRLGGEDGAAENGYWDVLEPVTAKKVDDEPEKEAVGSIEAKDRRPSVTVLMNAGSLPEGEELDAKAKTPENGW